MLMSIMIFSFSLAKAQNFGYLVKIDGDKIYIDITESEISPKQNDSFTVFTEGEELFNPVTKKSLGKISNNIAEGKVTEVSSKYAIGKIDKKTAEIKTGYRVKWHGIPAPLQAIQTQQTQREIIWKSKPVDGIMRSLALGDINSDGRNELICVFSHELRIYTRENDSLKLLNKTETPALFNVISVEVHKFENAENPHIFMTGYEKLSDNINTKVFEVKNGKLTETTQLKWLVRTTPYCQGLKKLYIQELFKTDGVKPSIIRELTYKKRKFKAGEKIKLTGLKWIYGFNITDFDSDGKPETVYITSADKIRLQKKKKGHRVDTARLFGKTPHFVNVNSVTLYFYPRIPVCKNYRGEFFIYGIENKKKSGILARAMGLYEYAILHRLKWTGSMFEDAGTVKLPGYVYDITAGSFAGFKDAVVVPCITLDERTIIEILPY